MFHLRIVRKITAVSFSKNARQNSVFLLETEIIVGAENSTFSTISMPPVFNGSMWAHIKAYHIFMLQ